ncbi:MAG TPA: UvrD-helicase domain-containing protein [Chthonomonadaceae bacterium]|nr:UvrD-helicase domain-containing protein [Chthonomonadaceae bacterium]
MREFTPFQQQAIVTEGEDICVAAGAGSGKTGVLVERFVRIVTRSKQGSLPPEQRAGVDQILVITFTEKATKEMKTRIVVELTRLGCIEERRQVETAYISTIHGFCSRLLQENPFEAGVDPQFTVIDEPQAKRLLRQTFEEVIAEAYAREDAEIAELVASVQAERTSGPEGGEPLTVLTGAVEMVMGKLRGAGKTLSELERHWLRGNDATAAACLEPVWALLTPVLTEVTALTEALGSLRLSVGGTLKLAQDTVLERAPRLRPHAASLPETLIALEEVQKAAGKARPRPSGAPSQEMEMAQILARLKVACEEASALFGVVAAREEQAGRLCHRLLGLVIAVWRAYEEAKRRRGALDTDDLQAEGVRLLEEAPHVRARYARRFRHLMIDEFQDTNPLQMRLIALLHGAEGKDGREKGKDPIPNFLFVVGDVQQSIYAFRHAEPALFRSLERRFREERAGKHVPLAVNFRSRPEILQLVSQVFSQVWRDAETPFVPLTPGAAFDPKPAPSLEVLLTQDLPRRDYVRLEAEALAARIQEMVEGAEMRLTSHADRRRGEPVAYRDVAVLLRSLTDIQKYEEAFARRGVPYFVVGGGRGYYARSEIRDLMNVLTVLDTPLDDVALAATLRSPLVGADVDTLYRLTQQARHTDAETEPAKDGNSRSKRRDALLYPALRPLLASGALPAEEAAKLAPFLETMETLRAQEDRLPVGHLLERLIALTHYDARLLCRPGGRRRLANVRKLLQMANADSVMGAREFIRRLRDLEKLSDREGDAPTEEEASDVVRFLTIHGAKGLEFPIVVLADLSRNLQYPERGLFVCEPAVMALGARIGGEPNVAYKAIEKRRQEADRQESDRLLYVAMTRAREHLILCGNLGRNYGHTWSDNLFPQLGLLEAPPEPQTQTLMGGLSARVAPLSHYVHAPLSGQPGSALSARRQAEARADRLAEAILSGQLLEAALANTP